MIISLFIRTNGNIRFLDIFGEEYYRANPHLVSDADSASFLAMGTIMHMIDMRRGGTRDKEEWIKSMHASIYVFDIHVLEQIHDDAVKNPWSR